MMQTQRRLEGATVFDERIVHEYLIDLNKTEPTLGLLQIALGKQITPKLFPFHPSLYLFI